MADGITEVLADLCCQICNELFDNPLELSCGHVFCSGCLDTFTSRKLHEEHETHGRGISKDEKGRKFCMTCREFVHIASRNPSKTHRSISEESYVISTLYSNSQTEEARVVCSACQFDPPSPAFKTCLICNLSYCKECVDLRHPMKGVFSGHTLSAPTETPYCPDHHDQFKVYCVSCQQPICYLCDRIGGHQDHIASDLESSFKSGKVALQEKADTLEIFLERSKGKIDELKNRKLGLIAANNHKRLASKHNFEKIVERLKKTNSDLLSHLDQENEQKIKDIDDLTRPLEQDMALAERFLVQLNADCLSHDYNLPFLMALGSLSKRADNVNKAMGTRLEEITIRDKGHETPKESMESPGSKIFLRFDIDCLTGDAEVCLCFNYKGQKVKFPDFTFDPETAHESVLVKGSGKHLANSKHVSDNRFAGALANSSFGIGVIYFETELKYSMKPIWCSPVGLFAGVLRLVFMLAKMPIRGGYISIIKTR